jgi:hypothetical protein
MGADSSKFRVALTFVLQILPADNLKGLKMQLMTNSQNQKHKE